MKFNDQQKEVELQRKKDIDAVLKENKLKWEKKNEAQETWNLASDLKQKSKDLKKQKKEIRKSQLEVDYQKEKLKIQIEISKHKGKEAKLEKEQWQKEQKLKLEHERKLLELESKKRKAQQEAELREMEEKTTVGSSQESCPKNKVYRHKCQAKGKRIVEYITYTHDSKSEKCTKNT